MTKLNWGMIGGGEGSRVGPAYRTSAAMDGLHTMAAGALDANADKGQKRWWLGSNDRPFKTDA